MKHNWTYKKLGELVDVLNGYAFKSSNYVKDGIRVIRIANVQKGKIVDEAPAFYPLSAESELTRYMLHEDDILLSLTGNVGRVGLLPKEMLPAALNQRVACLRIKDDTLMFKFLYQFLNSDYFEQKCIESSRGIAQLNMSTEWLKDYLIPIPSLSEQESIVAELDAINHLIDLQEQQLREYDRLAQSLFYSTFGDPVSNPKGWEVKNWSDVLEIINGKNQSAVVNPNGKYLLCGSGGEMGRADNYLCEENSVIIGRKGNINRPLLMREKFWNVDTAFGLQPKKDVMLVDYLYQFCVSFDFENLNVAVTIPSLRKVDLLKIRIPVPPLALQQSFAAQIEAIEQQKALVRKSLEETRTLLAARMQYYFE